jgi:hypothetical protein
MMMSFEEDLEDLETGIVKMQRVKACLYVSANLIERHMKAHPSI